jgi:diguanylate cyclase (GGDEF)-like protein
MVFDALSSRHLPARVARFARRLSFKRVLKDSFVGRLTLTLILTLTLLSGVNFALFSARLTSTVIDGGRADARAEAQGIEQVYASVTPGRGAALHELREAVDHIAAADDVTGVFVIDVRGVVVAAADPTAVGAREFVNGTLARSGQAYAGREREATEDSHNFEYVQPLRLGGQRYALEIDKDGEALRSSISALRRTSLLLLLAALVCALPAFFLLGGRKLVTLHRRALLHATRDALTGLGNTTAFHEELHRAIAMAARDGEPVTVAVLDVDDFKLVNDRRGHRAGDEVLLGLAQLLQGGRPEDRGFRIGGDEFALILPRTAAGGATARLTSIRRTCAETLAVTLSCGIAELDPQTPDAETMIEEADAATYEAKRLGRDRVARFADLDDAQIVSGSQIAALHELLAGAPPDIAFQPIWELADDVNRIIGYEALARPDPSSGLSPGDAFAIAERIGRAHQLDALCRGATLARAHELPDDALLFLNVAPQSLDHDELAGDALVRAVRAAGLEPARVVLEITERSSARLERVVRDARRLRGLGFKLALDDVGAGNAGLEMLRRMPVDFVKIDRDVIVESSNGGAARAVLHAVLSFAAESGAYVIAEGIETEAMLDHVRHPPAILATGRHGGVQGVQGYLLGRPSTARLTAIPYLAPWDAAHR